MPALVHSSPDAEDLVSRLRRVISTVDLNCQCRVRLEGALDRFTALEHRRQARQAIANAREQRDQIIARLAFLAEIDELTDPGGEADQILMVTVGEADESSAFTHRLFLTNSEVTTVRGKTAIVGRIDGGADDGFGMWTLLWVERPGEAISLVGMRMDRRDLEAIAETLQPVDDARWRELLESTKLGDLSG